MFTILFMVLTIFFLYLGFGVLFRESPAPRNLEFPHPDLAPLAQVVSHNYDFSLPTPAPLGVASSQAYIPPKLKQTAWIADWAFQKGFDSFKNNIEYFHSVSPVWYHLTPEGGIRTNRVGYDQLKQLTKEHGVKLIPSIASFDAEELHKILGEPQKLQEHINFLKSEIDKYDYDGIDIDYESMYLDDQPYFLQLVRELYDHLDPKGKLLSVAVMPKWNDADVFTSLRQTREAQDWYELGQIVHELRIMTYNVTNYDSKHPGPVAPYDWLVATLRYALTRLPAEKIMLGLPLYGYDGWSNNNVVPDSYFGILSGDYTDKGQADAVTQGQVAGITTQVVSDIFDHDSKERIMRYTQDGKEYVVYYPDLESTRLRVELAREMGIGGVAYWRMGDEDTRVYSLINN